MNPPAPQPQLTLAGPSRPVLDLNVAPREEGPEEMVPAAPAPAAPLNSLWLQEQNYTLERICREYNGRRAALVRAITTDEEEFFEKCDPSLESMYLYGHTNGSWEVREPGLIKPPRQPEPMRGINLFRDSMERVQWLQEVARYCDSWLISISFFVGAKSLTASARRRLFNHISRHQTVHEEFCKSKTYRRLRRQDRKRSRPVVEDEEVYTEDDNFCQICGDRYHANGFWIRCDDCCVWAHGKCVKMRETESKNVGHYVCPECRNVELFTV